MEQSTLMIVSALIAGIVCLGLGILLGIVLRRRIAEAKIGSAEEEAKRIVEAAKKQGEQKKKESLIEAKEEILRAKNESERELRERRNELNKQERRLVQKEESLDKKHETIDRKDEALNKKMKENADAAAELERMRQSELDLLERMSGYSAEQAKAELVSRIEGDAKLDAAKRVIALEQQIKEEADNKAKLIITQSIQRMSADLVSEATVSVVNLPSDEMKGRIIGREGRNIRTIETMTGVDLIIDDMPEAITLSSFDPIRRVPAARWTPSSSNPASAPSLRQAFTASMRSLSSCSAGCASAPATGRMCSIIPLRSPCCRA